MITGADSGMPQGSPISLGLSLSPEKTRIVALTGGKEGFDFLGFHLRKVESWKWRGKYLQRRPAGSTPASPRRRNHARLYSLAHRHGNSAR